MRYHQAYQRVMKHALGMTLAVSLSVVVLSCGGDDQKAPSDDVTTATPSTTSQQSQSDSTHALTAPPQWIQKSRSWPDTLYWNFDSTLTYTVDDLVIRLRIELAQDISGTRFQNEKPLMPEILTVVSPVPKWDYARTLAIDSLAIDDPIGKRRLPTLPILSFQRVYEDQVVRTMYYANLAKRFRVSADLEDGQVVDPTLYFSWEGRTIIATIPPLAIEHVVDPTKGRDTKEVPPDYRSDPPIPPDVGP